VLAAFVALAALVAESDKSATVLFAQGITGLVNITNTMWPYRRDPERYRDGLWNNANRSNFLVAGGNVSTSSGLGDEVVSGPVGSFGFAFGRTIAWWHGVGLAPFDFHLSPTEHGELGFAAELEVLDETLLGTSSDKAPDGGGVSVLGRCLESLLPLMGSVIHVLVKDGLLSFGNFSGFGFRGVAYALIKFELNCLSSTAGLLAPIPVNDEVTKLEPQLKRLMCRKGVADVHLKPVNRRKEQVVDEDKIPSCVLSDLACTASGLIGHTSP
jgi:hypothetical protein